MTVYPEIRNRQDKAGRAQIRIVIQDGTKRRYIPLPIKLLPTEWDKDKKQVRKHMYADVLNKTIRQKVSEIEMQLLKGEFLIVSDSKLFRTYAIEALSDWEHTKSPGTLKAYRSMLRQFNRYKPETKLEQITPQWLMEYERWCRQDGCNDAGTLKRVQFIATVIHYAIRYGHLQTDPFQVYQKPKKINPKKIWLTMEELAAISDLQTDSATLQHTATWFLFACFTGLRYSDVQRFNPARDIQDGRIVLYTTKTGEVVSIAVINRIRAILDNWPQVPVFSNQKCNQYLKAVAFKCGIDKPLTFHSARHTFAVQSANHGISIEVTSKLLGHSDLRSTSIYYKIVNQRIDEEMEKWG